MSELPKGWSEQKLSACAKPTKGKKPKILQENIVDGFTPYIDIRAFEFGVIRQYADISSSKLTTIDDILMVWDGARSGLVGMGITGAIGSTIVALKPTHVLKKYLYYFLLCKYDYISTNHKGTGIPHVDPDILWDIDVPLPPTLNDQKRIVERLELLLGKINKANERLEKIPSLLMRFRQSVLSSACSGKLTSDWRDENDCGEWERLELNNLAKDIRIGPFGTLLHASDYVDNGIPVINPKNIIGQQIIPDYTKSITKETLESLSSYKLHNGDILIARRGDMGRTAPVTEKEEGWFCGTGSMIIRLKERYNPLLYSQLLSGQEAVMYLEMNCKGSTMKNLNEKIVKSIPLPSIPLPEQKEIVFRIDKLFTIAEKIEHRYKNAKAQLARAEKAIYAKAFRGELIRQTGEN